MAIRQREDAELVESPASSQLTLRGLQKMYPELGIASIERHDPQDDEWGRGIVVICSDGRRFAASLSQLGKHSSQVWSCLLSGRYVLGEIVGSGL